MVQLLRYLLADLDLFSFVIVTLRTEAVHMNHWKLDSPIASKDGLLSVVQANEVWQKSQSRRGKVHDIVVEHPGLCYDGRS